MPRPSPYIVASSNVAASPAAAAETAVCTVAGIETQGSGFPVLLDATASLTIGTAGVSCRLRIRQGSGTGGAVVYDTGANTVTAASLYTFSLNAFDNPPEWDNGAYTLTITVGSASAASTVSAAQLIAQY